LPSLHGVWVAVTVFAWCGVRVRVIVHGCWGRHLCTGYGVGVGVIVWGVGCACCFCTGCGVRVGVRVIAQRVVSRPRSLSGMWVVLAIFVQCVVSCSWLLRGMLLPPGYAGELPLRMVLGLQSSRRVGVTVAIIAQHVGCRHHLCAVCGVAIAIVAPHGCHGHGHHAMWCCSCGGCCYATWCCSCGHCHWTTKEEVSRKKRKENVQAGRCGACSCEGHSDAMPSQSVVGPGRPLRERATCCVREGPPSHCGHNLTELISYLVLLFWSFPRLWNAFT
jgi:hypothetical protein